jgi:hypothetical protein
VSRSHTPTISKYSFTNSNALYKSSEVARRIAQPVSGADSEKDWAKMVGSVDITVLLDKPNLSTVIHMSNIWF